MCVGGKGWNNPGKNDDVQTRVIAVGVFWTFLRYRMERTTRGRERSQQ